MYICRHVHFYMHTPCTHIMHTGPTHHICPNFLILSCTHLHMCACMCAHTSTHTHTRLGFLKFCQATNSRKSSWSWTIQPRKGRGDEGRENEVYVGGVRQGGAREPSAEEKNPDRLKKGKPSDRAGMQAVIRISSTVSRFEEDRQTGCTCSMAIPSLDNVRKACMRMHGHACLGTCKGCRKCTWPHSIGPWGSWHMVLPYLPL